MKMYKVNKRALQILLHESHAIVLMNKWERKQQKLDYTTHSRSLSLSRSLSVSLINICTCARLRGAYFARSKLDIEEVTRTKNVFSRRIDFFYQTYR